MKVNNHIQLNNYLLISLYKPNDDIIEYLKVLNSNLSITTYFGSLTPYIGRKNAYFIVLENNFIGFIMICKTRQSGVYELLFGLEEKFQHQGVMTEVVKELTDYLLVNGYEDQEVLQIVINAFNPISKSVATNNSYTSSDNFKLIRTKQ